MSHWTSSRTSTPVWSAFLGCPRNSAAILYTDRRYHQERISTAAVGSAPDATISATSTATTSAASRRNRHAWARRQWQSTGTASKPMDDATARNGS